MAWRLATWPTRRWPSSVKATTDGVVRAPSAFGMTSACPPSITAATTEFVVPRSIPTALAIPAPLMPSCTDALAVVLGRLPRASSRLPMAALGLGKAAHHHLRQEEDSHEPWIAGHSCRHRPVVRGPRRAEAVRILRGPRAHGDGGVLRVAGHAPGAPHGGRRRCVRAGRRRAPRRRVAHTGGRRAHLRDDDHRDAD